MDCLKILIAYNNDNITKLLETIIETRYNSHIDVVKHEFEFFKLTEESKYDVILMDSLFSKDAFHVIEKYRRESSNSKVPIGLFISNLTEEAYLNAVELEIFDFLSRPFSLDHIYLSLDYIAYSKGYREDVSNRRASVRSEKKLYMKYNLIGEVKPGSEKEHVVTTDNISIDGVSFTDNLSISKDDELKLEIMLENPYDSSSINTTGIIKWAKEDPKHGCSFGVEFLELTGADRLRLNNTLYSY